MKPYPPGQHHPAPRAGFALVIVLGLLVLLTVLVVAFFSSVTTDYVSTRQYSNGAAVKQLADTVVQVAMGQIKTATSGSDLTWASQPGMIRTYDASGNSVSNYKLYSSDAEVTSGPLTLAQVADYDTAWRDKPAAWTDLNAPVTDAAGGVDFPIIDGNNIKLLSKDALGNTVNPPYWGYDGIDNATGARVPNGDTRPDVEGFAIDPRIIKFDPDKPPSASNTAVPIPVKWLYQLRDGTFIAPDASSATTATFVKASVQPSTSNPIIGRVAFWTDDETGKVNINTACGDEWNPATPAGAFWDVPRVYTSYDYSKLAAFQPVQHEYQRYPGHPATVYLSAIFPFLSRDQLFSIIPRISGGGSQGGTVAATGTLTPDADRLYASVDELLFKPTFTGNARDFNGAATSASGGTQLFDKSILQRSKFFLSASSRAPEVNLFNKPRVAIWPVDQDVVKQAATGGQSPRGTAFDNLIAFCAHLGPLGSGNDYFFQRSANGYLSQTQDYDLVTGANNTQRNHLLYTYLQSMANANIPGFGGTLASKFGSDTDQVLTEILDYIRCVNPSDDNIAFKTTSPTDGSPTNDSSCYTPNEFYTTVLLAGGYNTGKVLNSQPYHAFIAPTKVVSPQLTTQGFGRTVTLSELGLSFICNADGSQGTFDQPVAQGTPPTSGSTFYRLESNQPYAVSDARAHNHKRNINLVQNTPLTPTQRRVQGILLLNPYTVSPGYSTMHMDIGFEVTGLDGITVNDQPAGFPADKTIVMSNSTYRTPTFGVNLPFFFNSYLAPIRALADAPGQTIGDTNTTNPKNYTNTNSRYPPFRTYEFISSPLTVDVSAGTMSLKAAKPVTIKIWHLSPADKANGVSLTTPSSSSALIQTITLDSSKLVAGAWQIPTLPVSVDANSKLIADLATVQPENLWDFSWAGVYGDYTTPGRLFDQVGNPGHYIESNFVPEDVAKTLVPGYPTDAVGVAGDYRLLAAKNMVDSTVFVPHRLTIDAPNAAFNTSFVRMFINGWQLQAMIPANVAANVNFTDLGPGTAVGINAPYGALITSIPPSAAFANKASNLIPVQTGDYDNGMGSDMDGPFINKPDTGYQYQSTASQQTYPYYEHFAENSSASFFSPNRQIPSPGMFGSLPVGVIRNLPWRTLLFRPQPTHPDGVPVPDASAPPTRTSPYAGKVADHLIMDWFWMPVVEPYALSEPFSTAGKVNMNYQLAPFTYITRATAVDALLKSQRMLAIPDAAASTKWKQPLGYSGTGGSSAAPAADYRSDLNLHVADGTLRQFDETFSAGNLFRSPTQICDIYLTPQGQSWTDNSQAESFWATNKLTGDNSRERPYTNLYGCLTTKSNSYTVHFRAQALQKAAGTPANQWVSGRDVLSSEYRGSTLIERYVDANDATLPDFATNPSATLDGYYKFRVVSTKKFTP